MSLYNEYDLINKITICSNSTEGYIQSLVLEKTLESFLSTEDAGSKRRMSTTILMSKIAKKLSEMNPVIIQ